MTILQALLLGAVQGVTEFLPVSSSAHLIIVQNLFRLEGPILLVFDIVVHVGTLLAIFIYFAKDLFPRPKLTGRMWGLIFVANIPTVVIGLLLKSWMKESFNLLSVTAVTLLINSVILWSTKWVPKADQKEEPGWWDSVWIGVSQGISILPGISRSGATVTAALWLKVKSEQAVKFSFFVGILPIIGASIFILPESMAVLSSDMWPALTAGFISAFVSGYWSISILFRIVSKGQFHFFGLYTFVVAVLSFVFSFLL